MMARSVLAILGALGASLGAGAALGGLAGLVPLPARAAVVTAGAIAVLAGTALGTRPVQLRIETPQGLRDRGPAVWSIVNSALLGLGFASRISFWLWFAVPLGVFLAGSWLAGAVMWGTYGASRAVGIVVAALAMRRAGAVGVADRLLGWRRSMDMLTRALAAAYSVLVVAVAGLG